MKRAIIFLMVFLTLLSCAWSKTTQKALVTTFTASGEVYSGFSKKNVINTVQLTDAEKYNATDVIKFKLDPVHGYYHTGVFYAYCQSFSTKPVTVVLSAPLKMSDVTNPKNVIDATFDYELIYTAPAGGSNTSKAWVVDDQDSTNKVTITETGAFAKPRVVMSQPIEIKVLADNKVGAQNKYTLTFTLAVTVNG